MKFWIRHFAHPFCLAGCRYAWSVFKPGTKTWQLEYYPKNTARLAHSADSTWSTGRSHRFLLPTTFTAL